MQPRHACNPFGDFALRIPCSAKSAKVTFYIGSEHRDAGIAEGFSQPLQGHGFAGAGRAGYQAVPIGQTHRLPHCLAHQVSADNNLL